MDAPFCGCNDDSDCGARDSGRICDGGSHKCVDGCSPAPNRNHCPAALFCTSSDLTGNMTGVCTTHCVVDSDCAATPERPYCLNGGGGNGECVQCRNDGDCAGRGDGRTVCALDSYTCVPGPDAGGGGGNNGDGGADGSAGSGNELIAEITGGGLVCAFDGRHARGGAGSALLLALVALALLGRRRRG
jgi:hypothetical protein